jgi:chromate transporter
MTAPAGHSVPFSEALRVWARIGLQSFGGPAGQIALMHRVLVDEKRWISERRFLHALNYCMLLPGPEAQQLAIYAGWLMHGYRGGIVAGVFFVIPGFVTILALSLAYAAFQDVDVVTAVFFGLKAAVLAIVLQAVFRIGGRVLRQPASLAIAATAFVGIFFLTIPFPFIIAGALVAGLLGHRFAPEWFSAAEAAPTVDAGESLIRDDEAARERPPISRAFRLVVIFGTLWLAPTIVLFAVLGSDSVWFQQAQFFTGAAVVTFGGAYAVLAFVAQQAVETYGWLRPGEMLDGLGMAETTPGPLIQVVQFVGFMGAYRDHGDLPPLVAGTLAALLVTWVTFVPCFLWIFLGAPYVEALRGIRVLNAGLSAITAAVVGVILNLALWFGLHVIFDEVDEERAYGIRLLVPEWATVDLAALVLGAAAFVALFRFKLDTIPVLGGAAAIGACFWLVFRA